MLMCDLRFVGNRLLFFRRRCGLTQAEVAEAAGLSDRTYADIERGSANMRLDTLMRICSVLGITPNDVLYPQEEHPPMDMQSIWQRLQHCQPREQETALKLLDVYLKSCSR